ncbi:MAG: PAS domain S-box protein [Desulfobacteraceae bacterium]|nr:PAS domain S-box protein [Desulfobacteraceae bacterium]
MAQKPTYQELENRIQELEQSEPEYKQTKEKHSESEKIFKSVMDQSPLAIEIYDTNGKLLIVNDTWESFWNMKKSDMVNFNILNDPECKKTGLASSFRNTLQGIACQIPPSKYDPDKSGFSHGSIQWISSKMYPVKKLNGEIINIVLIMENITNLKETEEELKKHKKNLEDIVKKRTNDLKKTNEILQQEITEHKLKELALQESQSKLLLAQNISRMGDFTWDISSGAVTWSKGMHSLLKYDLNEKIDYTKVNSAIHHPDDLESVTKWLNDSIASGKNNIIPKEYRLVCKDGEILEIHTEGQIEYKDGEAVRLFGTCQDITERKRVEEAQKISESYLKQAQAIAQLGHWRLIPETGEVSGSDELYKIFGIDQDQTSLDTFVESVHPEDREMDLYHIRQGIKYGTPWDIEHRLLLADGTKKNVRAKGKAVTDINGNVVELLGTVQDISERKQAEEEIRQTRKMESIGTLAGGIAHDFNNLLYMIMGNIDLALEDIPEWNPVHENLKEVKEASLRAAGIVKQLLNFSRKTDQSLKPIGAVTVIKDTINFLRSTIPSTVEIKTNIPDIDIPILGDPTQINQILMNLFSNASQAMQDTGGSIEINIETIILDKMDVEHYPSLQQGNHMKIMVRDSGPGIAPDVIDKVFDPYFTTKSFADASGMGLSVVHGIVKNHNGVIFVDSKPGEGATFNIFFPVADELPEFKIEGENDIPHGTESILFIDDEESIVNMTGKILERLGYQLETQLNPVEALKLFKAKPESFDLVITDMTMPQMTGVNLAEKLKAIKSDIPVIICTGHSAVIDEQKANQIGIDGFVMKPVSKLNIAKAIRDVLDK